MNIAIQDEEIELTVTTGNVVDAEPVKVKKPKKELKYILGTGFRNRASWHAAKPKLRAPRYACGTCNLAFIGKASERCQCKPVKHRSMVNGQI